MAQISQRRSGARSTMPLLNLLTEAFQAGIQPVRYKSNLGIFIQIPSGRKFELVSKNGKVSAAGKIWYEELHQVDVPKLYQYEQPLINEVSVTAWDGSPVRVRKKNADGTWTILKAGEPYFRYNRNEYVVDIPYAMTEEQTPSGKWIILKPTTRRDRERWYKPLVVDFDDEVHKYQQKGISVASIRQRTRGGMRPRNLGATEEDQKREISATAEKILRSRKTLEGDDGITYIILFYASEVYILWDESRPFEINIQRTNFWDDRPATTETILSRPLRSFAVPDGMHRSWDLNSDSFKCFTHGCVVQMLYKSMTKRPRGKLREQGITTRIPILTIEQIQSKLDTIFEELGYKDGTCPFEAGWRASGANAHMILCFCRSMNIPCYVHHRKDLLTFYAPEETKPGSAIVNVSVWGDHCYFYGSDGDKIGVCEMNRVTSRKANESPDLAYSNLETKKERESDDYISRTIESPFRHEKTPPFSEWRTESQFIVSMTAGFSDIREEFAGVKNGRTIINEKRKDCSFGLPTFKTFTVN